MMNSCACLRKYQLCRFPHDMDNYLVMQEAAERPLKRRNFDEGRSPPKLPGKLPQDSSSTAPTGKCRLVRGVCLNTKLVCVVSLRLGLVCLVQSVLGESEFCFRVLAALQAMCPWPVVPVAAGKKQRKLLEEPVQQLDKRSKQEQVQQDHQKERHQAQEQQRQQAQAVQGAAAVWQEPKRLKQRKKE